MNNIEISTNAECGLRIADYQGTGDESLFTQSAPCAQHSSSNNPHSAFRNPKSLQAGFSLVTAIFLLVVIAALGTFAVTLSTTQHQSQTMDILGARAYQAALAGVEWAAFNVTQQAASSPDAWAGCVAGATVVVEGDLASFSPVTMNCSAASAVEGTSTVWVYAVSAVAHNAAPLGDLNYVEQVATAKLVK